MTGFFDEETTRVLKEIFSGIGRPLENILVLGDGENSRIARILAEELEKATNGKLRFRIIGQRSDESRRLGVEYVPVWIYDTLGRNIRYYGLPMDYEFSAFISIYRYIGTGQVFIPEKIVEKIKGIDRKLKLLVFVTPSCPRCPLVVENVARFALVNDKLVVEVVNGEEFPDLVRLYNVLYVPSIVVIEEGKLADVIEENVSLGEMVERLLSYSNS